VIYISLLAVLQAIGCIASIWFLLEHRPRQWRRIEAIDAAGFPLIVALVFTRGLVLTILNWHPVSRPVPNAVFSVAMLALVDVMLIVKLLNFRRFIRRDRECREQERKHDQPGGQGVGDEADSPVV
jgi:hypothetical protein